MPDLIRVTYVRSAIGRSYRQKRVIRALGLRRLHYSRVMEDTPSLRGMIVKVRHLVEVEPVEKPVPAAPSPKAEKSEVKPVAKKKAAPRTRKAAPAKPKKTAPKKVEDEAAADKPAPAKKKAKTEKTEEPATQVEDNPINEGIEKNIDSSTD